MFCFLITVCYIILLNNIFVTYFLFTLLITGKLKCILKLSLWMATC